MGAQVSFRKDATLLLWVYIILLLQSFPKGQYSHCLGYLCIRKQNAHLFYVWQDTVYKSNLVIRNLRWHQGLPVKMGISIGEIKNCLMAQIQRSVNALVWQALHDYVPHY